VNHPPLFPSVSRLGRQLGKRVAFCISFFLCKRPGCSFRSSYGPPSPPLRSAVFRGVGPLDQFFFPSTISSPLSLRLIVGDSFLSLFTAVFASSFLFFFRPNFRGPGKKGSPRRLDGFLRLFPPLFFSFFSFLIEQLRFFRIFKLPPICGGRFGAFRLRSFSTPSFTSPLDFPILLFLLVCGAFSCRPLEPFPL